MGNSFYELQVSFFYRILLFEFVIPTMVTCLLYLLGLLALIRYEYKSVFDEWTEHTKWIAIKLLLFLPQSLSEKVYHGKNVKFLLTIPITVVRTLKQSKFSTNLRSIAFSGIKLKVTIFSVCSKLSANTSRANEKFRRVGTGPWL